MRRPITYDRENTRPAQKGGPAKEADGSSPSSTQVYLVFIMGANPAYGENDRDRMALAERFLGCARLDRHLRELPDGDQVLALHAWNQRYVGSLHGILSYRDRSARRRRRARGFVPMRWINAGRGEQVNEQVNGLSEREGIPPDALRADPSTTYARASALLGVPYATARRGGRFPSHWRCQRKARSVRKKGSPVSQNRRPRSKEGRNLGRPAGTGPNGRNVQAAG